MRASASPATVHRAVWFVAVAIVAAAWPLLVMAQANQGLAAQIVLAREKNTAMLKQYNWNSRIELLKDGNVEDTRIELVTYGPDGQIQRSILNDEHASLPHGFLRHAIAENKRKQTEKYMKGLHELLDLYTLPSGGAVVNFISGAQIQSAQSPEGKPILQMTGNGVVQPGDTYALTVTAGTFHTSRVEINTTYEGDAVNVSATFKTTANGLTHLQYATVDVPSKQITLQVHNFDYAPNN